ncbi:GNAT family N-acetyltransferase [marine bacterium AO1-C]|nr:GNAT family N-acetyltransferase [marine bacterium AO1-C]
MILEETDNKGRAYFGDPFKPDAEMTYSKAGEKMIIIDHTEVSDALRGHGVGRELLDAIIEMVRQKGIKVMPLCPFAKSQFDKDESIRDVLS